jgi:hypothetical protein
MRRRLESYTIKIKSSVSSFESFMSLKSVRMRCGKNPNVVAVMDVAYFPVLNAI